MQTISKEEFEQKYGVKTSSVFPKVSPIKSDSFVQRVGEDISEAGANVRQAIQGTDEFEGQSPVRRGVGATAEAFNVIPKVGYQALPEPAREGLDFVGGKIGEGFKLLTDKISDTELFKGSAGNLIVRKDGTIIYQPNDLGATEEALGTVSSAGQISGDILLADQGSKLLQGGVNATKTVSNKFVQSSKQSAQKVSQSIGSSLEESPANIMQRVARIPKSKQANFEKMAGESVGEYLSKRGIFGNVEKVVEKLYDRFTKSRNTADEALSKLQGTFEPEPVKTALNELLARETRVSTPGAPSPILGRVQELANKSGRGGWTMSEINEIKRLFERNVKVDYLKQNLPESVARATNLDTAIREWQFKQAETLGLKNLPQINQETRLARQLMDDLGKEYAGSAGNNAVNLSDWIILSGGDPTAIGGFLLKKTFSSKDVQAAIAKFMNRGKPVLEDVQADIGTSQVKQLPSPTSGFRNSTSGGVPIKIAPRGSNIEMTSRSGITPSKKK